MSKRSIFRIVAVIAAAFFMSNLVLAQSGGAKGKVRSTKGDSLAGVEVTARLDGKDVKTVKTDSKGNFQMTGLAPGTYNFLFEKNGFASGVKFGVQIKDDVKDLGDRLILAVDSGSLVLINGSVFDQDGRSVTGAKVELVKIGGGDERKIATQFTNISGEFNFRQPDGTATYRLTATLKGVSASKEITVEGAARYRLALTLNLPKDKN